MERDGRKPTIPYSAGERRSADLQIERFPDGGVTITLPRRPVRLIDQLVISALVTGLVVWGIVSVTGTSGGTVVSVLRHFPNFWLRAVVMVGLFAVVLWVRASGRRSHDVIGISCSSVYLDVAGWFGRRKIELPRPELRGAELVFPRRSLSTRPQGLRIHLHGHRTIELGEGCSSAHLLTAFAELKAGMLRTSEPGSASAGGGSSVR
jgi:hypothetical protein